MKYRYQLFFKKKRKKSLGVPLWCNGLRIWCCHYYDLVAWVIAVAWVHSMAQERPHASGVAKKHNKTKTNQTFGVPIVAQKVKVISVRIHVWSLASLSGLRVWPCHKLGHRLQMGLRSNVAVAMAQASICSCHSTSSLGTSICYRCGYKKFKTKKYISLEVSLLPAIDHFTNDIM